MGGSRCRCVSSLRYVFLYSFYILFLTISCTMVHRLRVPPSFLAIQRWRQHSTTMPSSVITCNFSETPQKPLERPQDAPDTSKHRKKKTPIGRFCYQPPPSTPDHQTPSKHESACRRYVPAPVHPYVVPYDAPGYYCEGPQFTPTPIFVANCFLSP
jgi:hypothetical protein